MPQVATQPASASLCPGAAYELKIEVSGEGLSYQWRKDGIPISGATTAVYTIAAASASDVGSYDVQISNACASSVSEAAAISVSAAPIITQQPAASTSLNAGATLTLTVAADGPTLTYQWEHNGNTIAPPEGTQAALVVTNIRADQQGTYRCVITSACGNTTSQNALVSVVTGVDEEANLLSTHIVMSPMPAHDLITISARNEENISMITMHNVNGSVVLQQRYTDALASERTINIAAVPAGAYTLTVSTSTGTVTRLIVVQK